MNEKDEQYIIQDQRQNLHATNTTTTATETLSTQNELENLYYSRSDNQHGTHMLNHLESLDINQQPTKFSRDTQQIRKEQNQKRKSIVRTTNKREQRHVQLQIIPERNAEDQRHKSTVEMTGIAPMTSLPTIATIETTDTIINETSAYAFDIRPPDTEHDNDFDDDHPHMNKRHRGDIDQHRRSLESGSVNDEDDERECEEYISKWKQSPFAIGLSYTSWKEERAICCLSFRLFLLKYDCYDLCCCCQKMKQRLSEQQRREQSNQNRNRVYRYSKNKAIIACTACTCKHAPVGRVGNMLVLYQSVPKSSTVEIRHPTTPNPNILNQSDDENFASGRPKLHIVMGPYWMVALSVTFPIMLTFSVWTGISKLSYHSFWMQLTWGLGVVTMFISFFLVACTDPGIQYRYRTMSRRNEYTINDDHQQTNSNDNNRNRNVIDHTNTNEWIWNDQALSYRKRSAKYDPECAVIIDELDHVCPWTGTAVGKNNMCAFRVYLLSVIFNIIYDVLLLTIIVTTK